MTLSGFRAVAGVSPPALGKALSIGAAALAKLEAVPLARVTSAPWSGTQRVLALASRSSLATGVWLR